MRFFFFLIALLVIDGLTYSKLTFSVTEFELSNTPVLNIDPIRNPSSGDNSKHQNYIAEPFIAIVVLAHSLYEERNFSFYLPCYELHRQKDFFLIV